MTVSWKSFFKFYCFNMLTMDSLTLDSLRSDPGQINLNQVFILTSSLFLDCLETCRKQGPPGTVIDQLKGNDTNVSKTNCSGIM